MSEDHIRQIAALRPVVLINRDIAGLSRVLIDARTGLEGAVGALADLGHRHIVYVAGPEVSWSDQQRRAALSEAGARHEVRIEVIKGVEGTFEGGRSATDQVVATGATGAIAFDDFVAHGLLAGLAGRGMTVPDEFSLVGFDDVLGASTHPSLSSVFAPGQEAGRRAMELLLEQLETGVASDRRELPHRTARRSLLGERWLKFARVTGAGHALTSPAISSLSLACVARAVRSRRPHSAFGSGDDIAAKLALRSTPE